MRWPSDCDGRTRTRFGSLIELIFFATPEAMGEIVEWLDESVGSHFTAQAYRWEDGSTYSASPFPGARVRYQLLVPTAADAVAFKLRWGDEVEFED